MSTYTRQSPFLAKITQRSCLNAPRSEKQTFHVVLDLKGSGIEYKVGDSLGVYGKNSEELVKKTLRALGASEEYPIRLKDNDTPIPLLIALQSQLNITKPNKRLLQLLENHCKNSKTKAFLAHLLQKEQRQEIKAYLEQQEVWDILKVVGEPGLDPQDFCDCLPPLLPRLYSIASAQSLVGEEVHLTVARVCYKNAEQIRLGVCSDYLTHRAPLHQAIVPVYLQASEGFTLPDDANARLILVGPGTGIAPFRAFLQERNQQKHKGDSWLFFGERHKDSDYYYQDEWQRFAENGLLRIDTAFSRDQPQKIYVQDRMLSQGAELWARLQEGAYLFVCGDAQRMAKDVEAALLQIIQQHGGLSPSEAQNYLRQLRKEKRYLRDIY